MALGCAAEFALEVEKQRPRVGQSGEKVRGCRGLRLLVAHSVLNGQTQLGTDSEQNAQVVLGEDVAFDMVQREHADDRPADAGQWDRQGGPER